MTQAGRSLLLASVSWQGPRATLGRVSCPVLASPPWALGSLGLPASHGVRRRDPVTAQLAGFRHHPLWVKFPQVALLLSLQSRPSAVGEAHAPLLVC